MRLVDDEEPVRREVVEERPRARTRLPPGEVARVVLDPGAEPQLPDHLQVEGRALAKARRLQRPPLLLQPGDALVHLGRDRPDRRPQLVRRRDEVAGREDVDLRPLGEQLAGERVQLRDPLHLVAEELDPDEAVLGRRDQLQGVAADAEPRPLEGLVVALVLEVHQVAQDGVPPVRPAALEAEDGGPVVDRRAQAVDAAHRGHDDHVAPLEERLRGRVAELVDLLVAAGILLDVRVRPGQVGLRLVVVEVADEVLHGVVREEVAELRVELGGQGLVVGQDQGRPVDLLDDLGDRVGVVDDQPAEAGEKRLRALDRQVVARVRRSSGRARRRDACPSARQEPLELLGCLFGRLGRPRRHQRAEHAHERARVAAAKPPPAGLDQRDRGPRAPFVSEIALEQPEGGAGPQQRAIRQLGKDVRVGTTRVDSPVRVAPVGAAHGPFRRCAQARLDSQAQQGVGQLGRDLLAPADGRDGSAPTLVPDVALEVAGQQGPESRVIERRPKGWQVLRGRPRGPEALHGGNAFHIDGLQRRAQAKTERERRPGCVETMPHERRRRRGPPGRRHGGGDLRRQRQPSPPAATTSSRHVPASSLVPGARGCGHRSHGRAGRPPS